MSRFMKISHILIVFLVLCFTSYGAGDTPIKNLRLDSNANGNTFSFTNLNLVAAQNMTVATDASNGTQVVNWRALTNAIATLSPAVGLFAGPGTTGSVTSVVGDAGKFLMADGTWDIPSDTGLTTNDSPVMAAGTLWAFDGVTADAFTVIQTPANTLSLEWVTASNRWAAVQRIESSTNFHWLSPILYSLIVNSGSGDGSSYADGERVPIIADTAPVGDEFDIWVVDSGSASIDDTGASNTMLTMGADDSEITATYALIPPPPFLMTIDTALAAGDDFDIVPQNGGYPNTTNFWDYTVDWGDGSGTESFTSNAVRNHIYAPAGVYQISITGKFPGFRYLSSADAPKITSIDQWGIDLGDYHQFAWYLCYNMEVLATDVPKWNAVQGGSEPSLQLAFVSTDIASVPATWDLSWAVNMSGTFNGCSLLTNWGPTNLNSARILQDCFKDTGVASFPHISATNCTSFREAWSGCANMTSHGGLTLGALTLGANSTFMQGTWQQAGDGVLVTMGPINYDTLLGPPSHQNASASTWNGQPIVTFPQYSFTKWNDLQQTWASCSNMTNWPGINTENIRTANSTFGNCTALKTLSGNPVFEKTTSMNAFLSGVTLDTADWDLLLNNMAANNAESGGNLAGGSSVHSAAATAAIATLTGNGWVITDGGGP